MLRLSELCQRIAFQVVYEYLHDNLPPKELQDLFHSHPVLFVPQANMSELGDPQTVIEGKMMLRTEVRWRDSTGLFAKHATILAVSWNSCIYC